MTDHSDGYTRLDLPATERAGSEPRPTVAPIRASRYGVVAGGVAAAAVAGVVAFWLVPSGAQPQGRATDAGLQRSALPLAPAPRCAIRPMAPDSDPEHCQAEATRWVMYVKAVGPGRSLPSAKEMVSWFQNAGIPAKAVDVYALTLSGGRHILSLELSRESWADWRPIAANATGEDLCWRIGCELVTRGLDPPITRTYVGRQAARDWNFMADRNGRNAGRVGTLEDVASGGLYARIESWMNPTAREE